MVKFRFFIAIILMLVCVQTQAQKISVGGFFPDQYGVICLTDAQLSEIKGIDVSDGYEVVSFIISATVKGFYIDAPAFGNQLSDAQRRIINTVPQGSKIYIEDIRVMNKKDSTIVSLPPQVVIKDGLYARVVEDERNEVKVLVFQSFKDEETSKSARYTVKSFVISAIHPNYAFFTKIDGNVIDSVTLLKIDRWCYDVTNVVCIDNQTKEEHSLRYAVMGHDCESDDMVVYRSKDYFLKKNAKLDFIYRPYFKIDSVLVTYPDSYEHICSFKGDVFDDNFKKFIRETEPFQQINFTVYHGEECEHIPLYIVE